MSDKVKNNIGGTSGVNIYPDPVIEVRFYVPPGFPSKWKCVFTLYERERNALIDDTLREMSRLQTTTSNTI